MAHLLQKLKAKFLQDNPKTVSSFGFGGAAISGEGAGYGFGAISEEQSFSLLEKCFDGGVWLYDTAPIYGFGLSEERLGKFFKKERDKVCFLSKAGVHWHPNKRVDMNNDPAVVQKMLENSLRSLQTDMIDIYMIHWPDPSTDIRKAVEVLEKAKRQGKIGHIGLCNTNQQEIKLASEITPIEIVQSEFNIYSGPPQREFIKWLREKNISFMSWGTLEKGVIVKTVTAQRTFDPCDSRSHAPWWKNDKREWKYFVVSQLEKKVIPQYFKNMDSDLALYLLAFSFNLKSGVDLFLTGPKSHAQLNIILNCLDLLKTFDLPSAAYQEICTIVKEAREGYAPL